MSPEFVMIPEQVAGFLQLFILDLITLTIFGERMQQTKSTLQNFFTPLTSYALGPEIPFRIP